MIPSFVNAKMADKNQVQKRKRESLPYEANELNHEENDDDGNLLFSSSKMGDGNCCNQTDQGEAAETGKTEQIKIYRRSRHERDLTKERNVDSSASYDVLGFAENNIEFQDEPGIHKKLLGENVNLWLSNCSSLPSGFPEQVKRELKEDDFGSEQQEEMARKESAATIVPQDVIGDACTIFPPKYRQVQDTSERAELLMTMEAWSEEELDALWIGVRRYGPGNWVAMLKDPMLKVLELKTSDALTERWKIERENIFNLENFQQQVTVSAGDNNPEEARPSGTVKIHTPQTALVQSPDNEFHSESVPFLSSPVAFSASTSTSENPSDGTSGSGAEENLLDRFCDAAMGIFDTIDDLSDTESELSLKDWCLANGIPAEGNSSD